METGDQLLKLFNILTASLAVFLQSCWKRCCDFSLVSWESKGISHLRINAMRPNNFHDTLQGCKREDLHQLWSVVVLLRL